MKAMGGNSTKSDQKLFENMNLNNADVCNQMQAVAQARTCHFNNTDAAYDPLCSAIVRRTPP